MDQQSRASGDFPGGAVVKNPLSQCRGLGSIPGQGTRSHMHATTKSLHATTKEPTCRNEGAHVPQLRSPPAATKTQHNQINEEINI